MKREGILAKVGRLLVRDDEVCEWRKYITELMGLCI